ncbi:type 1 fimbrial protein [Pseudomonas sp. GD04087]|uniref:fimbrial protein n=1 Tax=Pseudomonas TaxID=286 RepID=UPI001F1A5D36|nr:MULTISPECIES: fimbrial protein [Pseudomonas]MCP1649073.1 major type 1 subunit fimbrin (pilin) [Pseudomonas nitroreducens]MCP1684966.1 major type 1 subunit fimbrin (pilin) [Pseudomonas nitroreducens]MDH0292778.1 type 1 fimbrial protein [Pseudomonas sp. GD04087]MDH1051451.1 type 1 fimbrial protein [Pseudomonas sp. GD03903]MDH2002435.1 type 1 fimbrial protein [Pseudomonas sp. GD03691]
MKSKLHAALICLASAGLCTQAFAATPQTGVINITGKVTETSCVLDSSATNIDVKLPAVNKDLLAAAQSSTGRTGFTMKVTGCADGVKVSAAFTPDSNVDAYGNLKNSVSTGGAAGVQVQLLDQNQAAININSDDATSQLARAVTVSGSNPVTLQYYAQYYSQAGSAGAGDVAAMANYQLTYE